jgi:hypothetical protein
MLNQAYLGRVLAEFLEHDNGRRPHRGLKLTPPDGPRPGPLRVDGEISVQHCDRLGGVTHEYAKAAAGGTGPAPGPATSPSVVTRMKSRRVLAIASERRRSTRPDVPPGIRVDRHPHDPPGLNATSKVVGHNHPNTGGNTVTTIAAHAA